MFRILKNAGWGAQQGFPGMNIDRNGMPVEVQLFRSANLPKHWKRLDNFEGSGYQRQTVSVQTDDGELEAGIYALSA